MLNAGGSVVKECSVLYCTVHLPTHSWSEAVLCDWDGLPLSPHYKKA